MNLRVWDKKRKEMFYQEQIKISHAPNTDTVLTELRCFFDSLNRTEYEDGHSVSYGIEDNRYILMLATGLRDKKIIDIFDGDIIKTKGHFATIRWNDMFAFFEANFGDGDEIQIWEAKEVEIIGNIYENPELLNG